MSNPLLDSIIQFNREASQALNDAELSLTAARDALYEIKKLCKPLEMDDDGMPLPHLDDPRINDLNSDTEIEEIPF